MQSAESAGAEGGGRRAEERRRTQEGGRTRRAGERGGQEGREGQIVVRAREDRERAAGSAESVAQDSGEREDGLRSLS